MSDDDDNTNLTPLSSSSSGAGGTRAWNVSVGDNPENPQPGKDISDTPEQAESSVAAPMTDKDHEAPVTETVELPVTETESHASEAAEPFAADVKQTAEDYPDPYEAVEADPYAGPDATEADAETDSGEAGGSAETVTASDETFTGNGVSGHAPEPAADEHTTEQLRQAVLETMAGQEGKQEEAFALFERISEDFSVMLASARNDAAVFSFKLMEFAQANAQNNFELARGYSHARTLPEIFNVQADYVKRQLELLNAQARELQALTSEITAKNAMDLQSKRSIG